MKRWRSSSGVANFPLTVGPGGLGQDADELPLDSGQGASMGRPMPASVLGCPGMVRIGVDHLHPCRGARRCSRHADPGCAVPELSPCMVARSPVTGATTRPGVLSELQRATLGLELAAAE